MSETAQPKGMPSLDSGTYFVGGPPEAPVIVPHEVRVAIDAAILAYMKAKETGMLSEESAQALCGMAFRSVLEMSENQRDRDARIMGSGAFAGKRQ